MPVYPVHLTTCIRFLGSTVTSRSDGWVCFDWQDYSVTPIPLTVPVTLSVHWKEGRGARPNCDVVAHLMVRIGVCQSVSAGEFSSHPDAQNWFDTTGIDVEDAFQGRGIGRHLLQRSIQEMHKVGYRHAAISGALGELPRLAILRQLWISGCGLDLRIPQEMGAKLKHVSHLETLATLTITISTHGQLHREIIA